MPLPYPGKNIPTARPSIRKIDIRSLSYGLSGSEEPYPVYQFAGGRAKWEYPRHNPFAFAQNGIGHYAIPNIAIPDQAIPDTSF
jgi:hypothetical protein